MSPCSVVQRKAFLGVVVDDSFVSVRVVGRLRSIDGGGNVCFRGFSELTLQGSVVLKVKLRSTMGKVSRTKLDTPLFCF